MKKKTDEKEYWCENCGYVEEENYCHVCQDICKDCCECDN